MEPQLKGRSILIVDDHEPHRTLLINYLGGLGCRCVGASGGEEGLARMREENFELVLLDLAMDDLDGMEVLKRAQSESLAQHYIMMSAQGTISNAVEAIRLGAHDFLVKPFELAQLLELVTRVLRATTPGKGPSPDSRLV
ncbi:MAG: response regulator, partial [Nannocystaceae bacterium]|nr:response regulator [Nannocystaceae bacterium]